MLFGGTNDPNVVPGAKVVASSDTAMSSRLSDREGKFSFPKLEPGIYIVEATCLGLHVEGNVRVDAGAVAQIALQLAPPDATRAK